MPGATVHGHGEAYMLMTYQCAAGWSVVWPPPSAAKGQAATWGCGASEVVWNSRDGVTPFVIRCRHCGADAQHTDWQSDVYAPDHQPEPGDRIFVDLDPEEALRKRREFVERWWDEGDTSGGVTVPPMREHPTLGPLGKDGAAAKLAEGDVQQFAGGTPHLIEVTDAVLDWLVRRGGGR